MSLPRTALFLTAGLLLGTGAARAEGSTEQLFQAGWSHYMGVGASRDREEAARWFGEAARQGDPRAQYWLGLMLGAGIGVPADPEAAREWLEQAAAQGHPGAGEALPLVGLAGAPPQAPAAAPQRAAEPVPEAGTPELARSVQSHLLALGYDPGYVDGIVGRRTIAAVRAFQRARGREADGAVDPALLRELRAALASRP